MEVLRQLRKTFREVLVNGRLFTIDESRVKDKESKLQVLSYKRAYYATLFRHLYGRGWDHRGQSQGEPMSGEPRTEEPIQVRRQLVTEARHTHNIPAARELWFKLGRPTAPAMYADQSQGGFFPYTALRRDPPKDGGEACIDRAGPTLEKPRCHPTAFPDFRDFDRAMDPWQVELVARNARFAAAGEALGFTNRMRVSAIADTASVPGTSAPQ